MEKEIKLIRKGKWIKVDPLFTEKQIQQEVENVLFILKDYGAKEIKQFRGIANQDDIAGQEIIRFEFLHDKSDIRL